MARPRPQYRYLRMDLAHTASAITCVTVCGRSAMRRIAAAVVDARDLGADAG
jgi:hypothetical protein